MFAFIVVAKVVVVPSSSSTSGFGKEGDKEEEEEGSSRFLRRRRRRVFKATKKKDEDDEDDIKTVTQQIQRRGRNFENKDDDFDDNVDVDDALRPSGATKPMDVPTQKKTRTKTV